jgi:hypothetical protein
MQEGELFLVFVRPLNRAGIPYIVTGGVAAISYGEPRLTRDVDLVVHLGLQDVTSLQTLFPADQFYVPPSEEIAKEIRREGRGQFNIIHMESAFKADFYPAGRDSLSLWAFAHKREIRYQGEVVILAPPEYVIVRKLEFYREGGSEKHVRDIRSMLAISGEQIDLRVVKEFVGTYGLQKEWQVASDR